MLVKGVSCGAPVNVAHSVELDQSRKPQAVRIDGGAPRDQVCLT
jgi:hypothetical protein